MSDILAYMIEKGIPLPKATSAGRAPNYPWRKMEVGDSVFIQGKKTANISGCFKRLKQEGMDFSARQQADGVRVWRIK